MGVTNNHMGFTAGVDAPGVVGTDGVDTLLGGAGAGAAADGDADDDDEPAD